MNEKNHRLFILLIYLFCFVTITNAQVTFIVESLPETTPPNDTIFISGTFNDWSVNDPNFMLIKQMNGSFAITLMLNEDTCEYKFTRGSWMKVETDRNNQYLPNRVIRITRKEQIVSNIANWQDLGGARELPFIVFYYFAIAFQGAVLIFLISRIQKKNRRITQVLYFTNFCLVILFLGIVCFNVFSPIWQTYLKFSVEALIFIWGPLIYLYSKALNFTKFGKLFWLNFIPFLFAVFLVVLKFFNVNPFEFIDSRELKYSWEENILFVFGALYSLIYSLIFTAKLIRQNLRIVDSKTLFNRLFLSLNLAASLLTITTVYLSIKKSDTIILIGYDHVFIVLSLIIIIETYFFWRHPEVLRNKSHMLFMTEAQSIVDHLKVLMEEKKVYREAELNIASLSSMIQTKPHILSKVLNEHFNKNFRDFVNEYRIIEFIEKAEQGKLEVLTFLGLAYEVGFNSKSTFNLAFKKHTNKSPRNYFKSE